MFTMVTMMMMMMAMTYELGMYRIAIFKIRPEPEISDIKRTFRLEPEPKPDIRILVA